MADCSAVSSHARRIFNDSPPESVNRTSNVFDATTVCLQSPEICCAWAEMAELMSLVRRLTARMNCGLELQIDLVFCCKHLFYILGVN